MQNWTKAWRGSVHPADSQSVKGPNTIIFECECKCSTGKFLSGEISQWSLLLGPLQVLSWLPASLIFLLLIGYVDNSPIAPFTPFPWPTDLNTYLTAEDPSLYNKKQLQRHCPKQNSSSFTSAYSRFVFLTSVNDFAIHLVIFQDSSHVASPEKAFLPRLSPAHSIALWTDPCFISDPIGQYCNWWFIFHYNVNSFSYSITLINLPGCKINAVTAINVTSHLSCEKCHSPLFY